MKCTIPEISWHNRDPVLSIDIQPTTKDDFYRLASAGTDSHVLIWHMKILNNGATSIDPVSDLTRHQRAVNVVRWSPCGQYLASGDDDANIIIWQQKADDLAIMLDGDDVENKEKWSVFKVLRGHKEDVYDLCWSPDSLKIISGSVDNTAIIWDIIRGLNDSILTDHKGFVQGVTWDPLGHYVATLSSDRVCRVFTVTGKQIKARISKGNLPVSESHPLHEQVVRYFHDDTLKSFFRRLNFSPDGSLIVMPAGFLEMGSNKNMYTTYIFTTNSLTQPAAILPSAGQYTIAVKFCPILFQIREDGPEPVIALPYRMVFAVATRTSIILYDTQQLAPFGIISNIHYTRLTDVTWSSDGRLLAVSSTDGFCSLVTFEPDELGTEYVKEKEIELEVSELNESIEEIAETNLNVSIEEKKEKKPSFLEQWTKKMKTDNEEKSTNMDVDDVLILEPDEKENEKVNVIINTKQNDKTTTKSDQNKSDVVTSLVKSEQAVISNISPAKPIAVRRKPRDQMNITQFLKPPKVVTQNTAANSKEKDLTNKGKIKFEPLPIAEDSLPQEPWTQEKMQVDNQSKKSKKETKYSETEDSVIDPVVITIDDDSQDIKLVLEDTQTEEPQKMEVCENKSSNSDKTTNDVEMKSCEDIKQMQNSSQNKNAKAKVVYNSTNNAESSTCNSNESKRDAFQSIFQQKFAETISQLPADLLSPLSSKKRVPLITLSSPKHKKKPF